MRVPSEKKKGLAMQDYAQLPFIDSVAIANKKICDRVTCFSGRLQCHGVIYASVSYVFA